MLVSEAEWDKKDCSIVKFTEQEIFTVFFSCNSVDTCFTPSSRRCSTGEIKHLDFVKVTSDFWFWPFNLKEYTDHHNFSLFKRYMEGRTVTIKVILYLQVTWRLILSSQVEIIKVSDKASIFYAKSCCCIRFLLYKVLRWSWFAKCRRSLTHRRKTGGYSNQIQAYRTTIYTTNRPANWSAN